MTTGLFTPFLVSSSTASTVNLTVNNSTTTEEAATGDSHNACDGKGPIEGAICNAIEDTKRSLLGGALDVTQDIARSVLEVILHRPAPKQGSEIVVFRPPTNQPMAGAYAGWTSVGLPLGFLVWVLGVGVALASRFRPAASFAAHGFQIERHIGRNLVFTLGSWWIGAFILHLANGLILAVAPRGDQLVMGPQSGVGSILGTGLLAGLLWLGTATVTTILLVATLLAYFLCLTFMVFLPVFSALMLFDTGGVLQTVGQFGQTGWDIFIRAAFFPLPAALVLGAGAHVAGGMMRFIEEAVAVGGFAEIAGMLAFAIVTFVTQLAALVATLWMLLGSRAARTAGGIMAGIGGAAMYSRAKSGAQSLAGNASIPRPGAGSGADATSAASAASESAANAASPGGSGNGAVTTGTNSGSRLGSGLSVSDGASRPGTSTDGSVGVSTPETPTGGRPGPMGQASESPTAGGTNVSAGGGSSSESGPINVSGEHDLPGNQRYQPGFVNDGEFQPVESSGLNRELVVREHDRFVDAYDSDGDHDGIYLRGTEDGTLYDASAVAGSDWGVSSAEASRMSRDAVFDARGEDTGRGEGQ
ncbi:hypothetical protein HWV07_11545 [Natronomonas salina]|uniref:hypothetical protein n=1 Tax=Natronomonas salina TaxID=1710540 RepID=UPI0015B6B30A|nr:hypothetical protein [Natronomonas salina]QLD89627.1 hypothetical protein HWV07_11545 [Natronomonas salina]